MELAREQELAAEAIENWLQSDQQTFVLSGYAGTGKTTLLAHLLTGPLGGATCATVTGKAMNVLKRKLPGAVCRTVHNLLYRPVSSPEYRRLLERLRATKEEDPEYPKLMAQYRKLRKDEVGFTDREDDDDDLDFEVLVVDEASMLSQKMVHDIEGLGRKVLLIGDEMQLPPVKAKSVFNEMGVNARLTEVHRQALESPVIRLATAIRQNDIDTVREFPTHSWNLDTALRADKVLCYTNKARHRVNRQFREAHGYDSETPLKGDTLLCIRNGQGYKWVNGAECRAIDDARSGSGRIFELEVEYEGEDRGTQMAYLHDCVANYRDCPELAMSYDEMEPRLRSFDYGYALTVHKAQGSEWEKVYLYDDAHSWMGQRQGMPARQRWLYTAVTRAKEALQWVK